MKDIAKEIEGRSALSLGDVPRRRVSGEDRECALNLHILRKMVLHRLRKMRMEKKRVSTKRRMMHAALDSGFLYEAVFSE